MPFISEAAIVKKKATLFLVLKPLNKKTGFASIVNETGSMAKDREIERGHWYYTLILVIR